MRNWLERAAKALSRDESNRIAQVLAPVPRHLAVLEVGCGFGRKLHLLKSLGFSRLAGVDASPRVAAAARDAGFDILAADDFETRRPQARCGLLVMAHVVEHLPPRELFAFLNHWLERLEPGGRLLIVSPMPGADFYLDFDHVKPYLPQGFKDFFGAADQQTSAASPHHLKLRDVRYRKSPWRLRHCRSLLLKTPWAVVPQTINLLLALAFFASGGLLGRTTGWVGLFEKKSGPVKG